MLAPNIGATEFRVTKRSSESLNRSRSIRTSKEIVTEDDTEYIPGVIMSSKTALSYGTSTVKLKEPTSAITKDVAEYTIHKIVDHEPLENGTKLYRIRLYYFGEEDDTLEPIGNLPRSKVVQNYRPKKLKPPRDLSESRVGLEETCGRWKFTTNTKKGTKALK